MFLLAICSHCERFRSAISSSCFTLTEQKRSIGLVVSSSSEKNNFKARTTYSNSKQNKNSVSQSESYRAPVRWAYVPVSNGIPRKHASSPSAVDCEGRRNIVGNPAVRGTSSGVRGKLNFFDDTQLVAILRAVDTYGRRWVIARKLLEVLWVNISQIFESLSQRSEWVFAWPGWFGSIINLSRWHVNIITSFETRGWSCENGRVPKNTQ